MTDIFSAEKRSEIMSKIRGKDTTIEILVRKKLWKKGIRFRLHCKNVPGTPDICSKTKKIAVFIDGCFWHGCPHCTKKLPETNRQFWKNKIKSNNRRRKKVLIELNSLDFKVLQFWECEIKRNVERVVTQIEEVWHS